MQDKESGKASTRMADLEDTIEKLVAVAKRKGYIDQDATVESLKADAIKNREKDHHEDAVSLMAAMKKNLDAQTAAVRCACIFCMSRCDACNHAQHGAAMQHPFSCIYQGPLLPHAVHAHRRTSREAWWRRHDCHDKPHAPV